MKITIQISDIATTIGNMLGFEDVMVMAIMYNPN